jgi:hypothetical protein
VPGLPGGQWGHLRSGVPVKFSFAPSDPAVGSTFRAGMLKIEISMKYPKTAGKFLRFFDEKVPE